MILTILSSLKYSYSMIAVKRAKQNKRGSHESITLSLAGKMIS